MSTAERRRYISERLHTDWGWENYEKGPNGWSYRQIATTIGRAFKTKAPAGITIKRDIDSLRLAAALPTEEELDEAAVLLLPENFPKFRKLLRGDTYETPPFQHAIFYLLRALAFKVPMPQWAIDLLDELDPVNPFPPNINELIVKQDQLLSFLLLLAPRHGKTDLLMDFDIWAWCLDPNTKIIFGNGTIKKTETFVGNYFMPILENHEELNRLYGPFKSDNMSWSRAGLVMAKRTGFHKSMSLQPIGITGDVLSLDADLIELDDISPLRRAMSETTTEGDFDWITTQAMTRREPHTAFIYVGSHVATMTGDLFEWLIAKKDELSIGNHQLIVKKIPAHRYDICQGEPHEQCVVWPTMRPYSFLEGMRGLTGDDAMYEAIYNQIPKQRKMMHFPSTLMRADFVHMPYDESARTTPVPPKEPEPGVLDRSRSWRDIPECCNTQLLVSLGFDPAASEEKGSSFSALVVLGGCVRCGRRYLIDYWKDRQSPEVHPNTIGEFVGTYPKRISVVCIEINAYQKSLSRDPRMQKLEQYGGFYVKEWNTDERKHDPSLGIPAAARHVKGGMVSIPYRTTGDQEFSEPLIKEFIRWPQKPNDLVMAFWLAELGLFELIEDARTVDAELLPGADKWQSAYHDEITFEIDLSEAFDDQTMVWE